MIILSKMKNKTFQTCLQGNYGDSLREFSNMSYGILQPERVIKSIVLG